VALGERIIQKDEHLVVWSPYAARTPFECWILPCTHRHDFLALSSQEATSLARMLQSTLVRLRHVLGDFSYNYYIHTAPLPAHDKGRSKTLGQSYHWHLELLPRLGTMAGLEWSTGLYINAMPPEEAARRLRDAS
jgi:UDPglucose--hexose-1-phosphate uridylyltransferase